MNGRCSGGRKAAVAPGEATFVLRTARPAIALSVRPVRSLVLLPLLLT